MINSNKMKSFIKEALKKLDGNWVMIGGTVLPLLGIDHRVTVDIDMVKINPSGSQEETLKLMEIAEKLSLPPESINQAGAFFLSKIKNFQKNLILIDQSKNCQIYRPNAFLFLDLKTERLSQTDLEDCEIFIKHNKEEVFNLSDKILTRLKKKKSSLSPNQEERLQILLEKIQSL
ncbi:MAG: nucleotidyl transferase AbiEii/AbiGii toxin family protein [Halobacteriovoraceae bacterium]|nr:nucleotidyl transferase AbiEii/AbiGii toxin family protein [Halobacteriovoraceae bacterium]